MKSITILAVFLAMATHSFSQQDAIEKYFGKYASDQRFTSVYISNKMFSMFSNLGDGTDSKDLMEVLGKLNGLRILTSDNVDGTEMFQDAQRRLVTNGFENLMEVNEKGKSGFKFLIREGNGKVQELLMVSGENKEFFLMSILGDIDLKKISKLSKVFNMKGLDGLDQLNKNK